MTDDYDRWNDALARHLLHEREGEPFFLYVDRRVLADASGLLDENEAFADFVSAVRSRCLGRHPFRWSRELARSWRDKGFVGMPPVLAVLGFTVLAAAERTTTHFQYYDDLNRLLGRPVQAKMPPGFDVDVPYLFATFNTWLDRTKRFGGATAVTDPHRSYVGWPLSQALLRPADGRELVALLHRAQLTPGGTLDGQALLRRVLPCLRLMADSPTRRRIMDAVERFPEMVEDRLLTEYRSWTGGAVPVAVRETSVRLRLAYDDAYGDWWFVGRRPTDSTVTRIRIGDWEDSLHARGSLEVSYPDPWSLFGRGEVGSIDERIAVHAPAAGPKWLRLDRDVGGWLEQPSSDAAAEQLRLLPFSHKDEMTAWRERELQELPTVPAGWTLWRVPPGVCLTESAHTPPTSRQPWLEGGFCLDPATRTYMRSRRGPDVAGMRPEDILKVDGRAHSGLDGRVTLPTLEPGEHLICCGAWHMRVRVVERLQEELHLRPELGWCMSGDGLRLTDLAEDVSKLVSVGAWVPDDQAPRPSTHVPIRTETIWVLGHEGEVAKRGVRPLPWLDALAIKGAETDLRRGLLALDFTPAFAVAFKSIRSPGWVVEVTGEPSSSAQGRGLTQLEVQQLVQRLLSAGVHPLAPDVERRWKRALARLMRAGTR